MSQGKLYLHCISADTITKLLKLPETTVFILLSQEVRCEMQAHFNAESASAKFFVDY
jgi:hypothetical protein